jgi:hypothetical protein
MPDQVESKIIVFAAMWLAAVFCFVRRGIWFMPWCVGVKRLVSGVTLYVGWFSALWFSDQMMRSTGSLY